MSLGREYLLRRSDDELSQASAASSHIERQAHEALARAFREAAELLDCRGHDGNRKLRSPDLH